MDFHDLRRLVLQKLDTIGQYARNLSQAAGFFLGKTLVVKMNQRPDAPIFHEGEHIRG